MAELRGAGIGLLLVGASLLAGCGGNSDDDSNDDDEGPTQCSVGSCGGDVVGTWDIESFCIAFNEPPAPSDVPECQDALSDYTVDAQGTLTFTADGMATLDLTTTLRLGARFTAACVRALSGGSLTQELCDALEAEYASNPEYASANCTFSPAACNCTVVTLPTTQVDTGAYSIQGNQLVIDGEASDYCVEGDRLTLGVIVPDGSYSIAARRAL